MYEITNKQRGPVQIMVRSRRGPSPREFTVKNLYGIGSGQNIWHCEDELMTDHIWRCESEKLITVQYIDKNSLQEGVK